jgi:Uma2 family endonuclease
MVTRADLDPMALDGTFMTEADYLALPETKAHVELVDGLVVCEPTPSFGHQRGSVVIVTALEMWARTRDPKATVVAAPLDIRFGPGRILQPDVAVYCAPLVEPVAMPVPHVPDLCVEIVWARVTYDRTAKRLIYAQAGVREYWTVLRDRQLVERWTGPGLDTREECRDRLTTPLLPGFELDVVSVVSG